MGVFFCSMAITLLMGAHGALTGDTGEISQQTTWTGNHSQQFCIWVQRCSFSIACPGLQHLLSVKPPLLLPHCLAIYILKLSREVFLPPGLGKTEYSPPYISLCQLSKSILSASNLTLPTMIRGGICLNFLLFSLHVFPALHPQHLLLSQSGFGVFFHTFLGLWE